MLANDTLIALVHQNVECAKYQITNGFWDIDDGPQIRAFIKRTLGLHQILSKIDQQLADKISLQLGLACEAYLNAFVDKLGYVPRTKSMTWSRANLLVDWVIEYFDDQDKKDLVDLMMTVWGEERYGNVSEEEMFDLYAGFVVGVMAKDRMESTR